MEALRRRVDDLEADLDYERRKAKKPSKAVSQVYERGGVVRRTDKYGHTEKLTFTGDTKKKKIDPDSLRGRFIQHVTRHV